MDRFSQPVSMAVAAGIAKYIALRTDLVNVDIVNNRFSQPIFMAPSIDSNEIDLVNFLKIDINSFKKLTALSTSKTQLI